MTANATLKRRTYHVTKTLLSPMHPLVERVSTLMRVYQISGFKTRCQTFRLVSFAFGDCFFFTFFLVVAAAFSEVSSSSSSSSAATSGTAASGGLYDGRPCSRSDHDPDLSSDPQRRHRPYLRRHQPKYQPKPDSYWVRDVHLRFFRSLRHIGLSNTRLNKSNQECCKRGADLWL